LLKIEKISPRELAQFAEQGNLYAILDPCDAPLVPPKMQELGARAISLFQGTAQEDYWAVAPHLARVDVELLRWLYENLWKEPWGIFVVAQVELADLQAHFRKLLYVQAEGGKNLFFRYYDPRVLSKYLKSCDATELQTFYGPVTGLATANDREIIYYSVSLNA
jgi:hypothetical protein